MNWYLAVFLALAVVLSVGVGPIVNYVLDEITRGYNAPDAFEAKDWTQYVNSTELMLKGGEHSGRILGILERLLFVTAPLSIDAGEITDKGYINQSGVLRQRSDLVERLYGDDSEAMVVAPLEVEG